VGTSNDSRDHDIDHPGDDVDGPAGPGHARHAHDPDVPGDAGDLGDEDGSGDVTRQVIPRTLPAAGDED
jgi:hypothetical protein